MLDVLSAREQQVMGWLVQGHSSKQVARVLCLSHLTVRKHRENLMRKLKVHNIAELMVIGMPVEEES